MEEIRYCDMTREDVEGKDVPHCFHPECLFDDFDQYNSIWATRIAQCVHDRQNATCELPSGHTMPHAWNKSKHERYEDRERFEWLMRHIVTCATCDLYPENGQPTECPELQGYWKPLTVTLISFHGDPAATNGGAPA
jgi:hypothetical protein